MHLLNTRELTKDELDFVIMGQLLAFKSASRKVTYMFGGKNVCRHSFLFLNGISEKRFRNIREHFEEFGVTSRTHGNTKRNPPNTTSMEATEYVKKFIENVSNTFGMSLPGRVSGQRDFRVNVLPSTHTYSHVYRMYKSTDLEYHVSYTKFCELWKTFHPTIIAMKPRSDLCQECQENNNLINKSVNLPEDKKSEALRRAEKHLNLACAQRTQYQENIKLAQRDIKKESVMPTPKTPNSNNITAMYSFDFAQMVQYPNSPLQVGPIYFKVPRRCYLFGVNNEGINRQTNYLIDEAVDCGKGSNSVISYLHHFFENHGFGEKNLILQADNCSGQNKNNFLMQYLCWRIQQGLHSNIEYNFLLAGHTKFSPDRCFGIFKKKYVQLYCSSLFEVADAMLMSSEVGTNVYELVGLPDGTLYVPVYDWKGYFDKHFNGISDISKYHHFRFDSRDPDFVFAKEFVDTEEIKIKLFKSTVKMQNLPNIVLPKGLSDERKYYLYSEIRQFCREGTEDLVAPYHPNPKNNKRAKKIKN